MTLRTNESGGEDERSEGGRPENGRSGYRFGTLTHVGLRRARNEDFLMVRGTSLGLLAIVCDGMGGHAGGERASMLAAQGAIASVEGATVGDPGPVLARAVLDANAAVVREALAVPEYAGMGTTLVAALVEGDRAVIVNVGDSRAYLLRSGGTLERITRDHSLVAEMVARGEITEQEAEHHPRRNIITRALGTPGVEGELFVVTPALGDVLLLASDGLHGMIGDTVIRDVLAANEDPARACDVLVERALEAGGSDNVTVIVLRRVAGGNLADAPTDPGEATPRRRGRPRGLGLILGVGFGAIAVFACLIVLFRQLMVGVEERGRAASDTSGIYVPDTQAAFDSAWNGDSTTQVFPGDSDASYDAFGYTPSRDSVAGDSVGVGDSIGW